ncbi:hypothetical protein F8O09_01195 [Pseudoclavibacter sp. CFCC 11306]|nr:hypothetical protein F8O09_01195 [Pseudoclavibacter sp. CFCC 11306]
MTPRSVGRTLVSNTRASATTTTTKATVRPKNGGMRRMPLRCIRKRQNVPIARRPIRTISRMPQATAMVMSTISTV